MHFERIADQKRTDFIVNTVSAAATAGAEVLDVGCGNGLISLALGKQGFRVTGIDVSEKTIETAKKINHLPNVDFRVVPAGALEVSPLKYSAIVCSEVLEHLVDPASLLRILHASLSENGVLVVTVPNGRGPRELFVTRPVQSLQESNGFTWRTLSKLKKWLGFSGTTVQSSADDLRHIQFFTRRTLSELAFSTCFRIEKIVASNFIEQVFPFSLVTKKSRLLQRLDCQVADRLPLSFTSGFMSVWKKMED